MAEQNQAGEQGEGRKLYQPHPKTALGPFYTEFRMCISCCVPQSEAPDLIDYDHDPETSGCYFKKQPETTEELERAIDAMLISCVDNYRYGGSDPEVIRRLKERGVPDCLIDALAKGRW